MFALGAAVSTRVRKLAVELDVPVDSVVETLGRLGFPKYRSETDLVPDDVAERVRRTVRLAAGRGGTPPTLARIPAARPVRAAGPADLMSQLVPGVVPVHRRDPPTATPSPRVETPVPILREPPPREVRARPEPVAPPPPPLLLGALLSGIPEAERPAALAQLARRLGPRLGAALAVLDEAAVREGLSDGCRGTEQDEGDVSTVLRGLADCLLLFGRRRLLVLGTKASAQVQLRQGLDRRIELTWRSVGGADVIEEVDVDPLAWDVAVVWGLEGRPVGDSWVIAPDRTVAGLCSAVTTALSAG